MGWLIYKLLLLYIVYFLSFQSYFRRQVSSSLTGSAIISRWSGDRWKTSDPWSILVRCELRRLQDQEFSRAEDGCNPESTILLAGVLFSRTSSFLLHAGRTAIWTLKSFQSAFCCSKWDHVHPRRNSTDAEVDDSNMHEQHYFASDMKLTESEQKGSTKSSDVTVHSSPVKIPPGCWHHWQLPVKYLNHLSQERFCLSVRISERQSWFILHELIIVLQIIILRQCPPFLNSRRARSIMKPCLLDASWICNGIL